MAIRGLLRIFLKKKVLHAQVAPEQQLERCLNIWHLIAIGLGSTLGATTYVVIGQVAQETAGPAIVLSFLVAATGSMLAGLCYAELGSRMPRAGSVYDYAYTAVGEFYAFIVSWMNTFEYLCAIAYVARSISSYMNSLSNGVMHDFFAEFLPIPVPLLADYFDILAVFIVILMGALISFGVKLSTSVHFLLTLVNLLVICFVIFAGAVKADKSNWALQPEDVPEGMGAGGFLPYGWRGMLDGAVICFFGFVGFESTTFATEEVKNPNRNLPISILITLLTICILFCLVSVIQTMMLPYYLLDRKAALAETFTAVGWEWASYLVMPGALCGMCASIFGCIMPLPRLWMSMARDGVLFKFLSRVSPRTKTPLIATIVCTIMSAFLAGVLQLEQLDKMLVVGTLMSYNAVAVCVTIMRYQSDAEINLDKITVKKLLQSFSGSEHPSIYTEFWANTGLTIFIITTCTSGVIWLIKKESGVIVIVLHVLLIGASLLIFLQPQRHASHETNNFWTPFVPFIPCLALYVNINLMVMVDTSTYIRTTVWFCLGLLVYMLCLFMYKKHVITDENRDAFRSIYIYDRPLPSIQADKNIARQDSEIFDKKKKRMSNDKEKRAEEDFLSLNKMSKGIIIQQAFVESNEEKEAKIIDLLDQVLQAEEDSYDDMISLQEQVLENIVNLNETDRRSVSEMSDACSDVSNSQILSKYDVIAQVHREDMPKVCEENERKGNEEEVNEKQIAILKNTMNETNTHNAYNDSETNSHTDESGYSDTMKSTINESSDFNIHDSTPYIPTPPPLDESFFSKPLIQKSYSFTSRTPTIVAVEINEESKPRQSVQSNGSLDDGHIVFGSDKQMSFMTKLNTLFQSKILSEGDSEVRKRSHSTGNKIDNTELKSLERPPIFNDLKKELLSKEASQNLRPINSDNLKYKAWPSNEDKEEPTMSRDEMKSKLESIFASGGPQLVKPRLRKSKASSPENSQTTDPSAEYISKTPKIEKNDTLKRQKDRFSAVLNSFILNLNKENEL